MLKRVVPAKEVYIEGYSTRKKFQEYFGISYDVYAKRRQSGQVMMIYRKEKFTKSKRGWRFKRLWVDTHSIIEYLHYVGYLDMFQIKNKGLKNEVVKRYKNDFFYNMMHLSVKTKKRIMNEMGDRILEIANEGANKDKNAAKKMKTVFEQNQY